MIAPATLTARCRCGQVAFEATGAAIASAVCYCRDCQAGSRQIEELPNAGPVRDSDGGTAYILYRRDRIACTSGAALLRKFKLTPESPTNRVVATCCNSAMVVNFDRGPFWVSAYRARFAGELPKLDMRVCTGSRLAETAMPTDVPCYPGHPPALMWRLLKAGLAMLLRR